VALPTTISGIFFLRESGQGRNRPWISSAGNVYFFARDDTDVSLLTVQKATNPTDSFSEVSTLDFTDEVTGLATIQDGDDIHVVVTTDADEIRYSIYSMSSDSFTTSNEDTTGTLNNDIADVVDIAIEEDGSTVVVIYDGAEENAMGAKDRVDYAKRVGGSWTVDQAVDDGGKVNFVAPSLCRGEADKFHLVYNDRTNTNAIHKSLTLGGPDTLSSAENVNDNAILSASTAISAPVYYDVGGVERITIEWKRSSDPKAYSSEIDDDGVPGAEEVLSDTTLINSYVISLAVDQKTVWGIFMGVDSDAFSDSNVDSAGWGTDTEEIDAITLTDITSNTYQRGSDIVLAYVYHDGSAIKYNEKVLRTVGGGPAAALRTLALTGVGI